MVGLGFLPGYTGSQAFAVSADGSVAVGDSYGTGSNETRAFRWTASGGMVSLGFIPGGTVTTAGGVSGDGSVVVGVEGLSGGQEAVIWDAAHGLRSLQEVLTNDYGLNLTGWTLEGASGVSADGDTIVGAGTDPSGLQEAWIAIIPEPGTGLLVLTGLVGLAVRRRRARATQ